MPEYREKTGDEKMEAFNDRTKRIDYPYVLEYESEAKIYEDAQQRRRAQRPRRAARLGEMAGFFAFSPA